jgi:two-component system KDP operon response regulator KdpE
MAHRLLGSRRMAPHTVLVVDDERDFRDALEAVLADEGFNLLKAGTAAEGVSMALVLQPEVVLMDVWLPDGRGLDALTRLRQRGFERPVVVVSGAPELLDALPRGADAVLPKPLDCDALCALLQSFIRPGARR